MRRTAPRAHPKHPLGATSEIRADGVLAAVLNEAVRGMEADTRARRVGPTFPQSTIHDLRITATGLPVSAGANVNAVPRMPGHASTVMTLDVRRPLR